MAVPIRSTNETHISGVNSGLYKNRIEPEEIRNGGLHIMKPGSGGHQGKKGPQTGIAKVDETRGNSPQQGRGIFGGKMASTMMVSMANGGQFTRQVKSCDKDNDTRCASKHRHRKVSETVYPLVCCTPAGRKDNLCRYKFVVKPRHIFKDLGSPVVGSEFAPNEKVKRITDETIRQYIMLRCIKTTHTTKKGVTIPKRYSLGSHPEWLHPDCEKLFVGFENDNKPYYWVDKETGIVSNFLAPAFTYGIWCVPKLEKGVKRNYILGEEAKDPKHWQFGPRPLGKRWHFPVGSPLINGRVSDYDLWLKHNSIWIDKEWDWYTGGNLDKALKHMALEELKTNEVSTGWCMESLSKSLPQGLIKEVKVNDDYAECSDRFYYIRFTSVDIIYTGNVKNRVLSRVTVEWEWARCEEECTLNGMPIPCKRSGDEGRDGAPQIGEWHEGESFTFGPLPRKFGEIKIPEDFTINPDGGGRNPTYIYEKEMEDGVSVQFGGVPESYWQTFDLEKNKIDPDDPKIYGPYWIRGQRWGEWESDPENEEQCGPSGRMFDDGTFERGWNTCSCPKGIWERWTQATKQESRDNNAGVFEEPGNPFPALWYCGICANYCCDFGNFPTDPEGNCAPGMWDTIIKLNGSTELRDCTCRQEIDDCGCDDPDVSEEDGDDPFVDDTAPDFGGNEGDPESPFHCSVVYCPGDPLLEVSPDPNGDSINLRWEQPNDAATVIINFNQFDDDVERDLDDPHPGLDDEIDRCPDTPDDGTKLTIVFDADITTYDHEPLETDKYYAYSIWFKDAAGNLSGRATGYAYLTEDVDE